MKKVIGGLVIIVSLVLVGLNISFAEGSDGHSVLRGRDIAAQGSIITVEGILRLEGTEWVLTSEDREYDIHLGPVAYRENKGFQLFEGNSAVVKGFLVRNQIAVMEITSNGDHIVLRSADGHPAWAGSGFASGRNRDSDHDHEHDHQNQQGDSRKEIPADLETLDGLEEI